jgi:hypothetical protein
MFLKLTNFYSYDMIHFVIITLNKYGAEVFSV